jgi:hypothetical protein
VNPETVPSGTAPGPAAPPSRTPSGLSLPQHPARKIISTDAIIQECLLPSRIFASFGVSFRAVPMGRPARFLLILSLWLAQFMDWAA